MRQSFPTRIGFALAVLLILTAPVNASVIVMDEESCTYSGGWSYTASGDVGKYAVQGDEQHTTNTSASATWTPGLSGTYDLQAHWMAWPTHSTAATYTINHVGGSTPVTVNQAQIAAQGNPNSLGDPTAANTGWGSGWYTLGRFDMDAASTVVLTNAPGLGPLSADALRVSDEGIIIDEYSAGATYSPPSFYFPRPNVSNIHDESTQYTHRWGGADAVTYSPGVTGPIQVSVSWAANAGHSSVARYAVTDAGGVVHQVDVSQMQYADQTTSPASGSDWSGWYNVGSFNLGPSSTVVLTEPSGASGAMAADAIHVRQLTGYEGAVVGDGPIGYWRLGDAAGSTTALNSGSAGPSLNGGYTPGKVDAPGLIWNDPNTAAEFNGSSSFVQGSGLNTAGPGGGNVFAGDWTIEAWFVRDSADSDWDGIFSNNALSGEGGGAPILTFFYSGSSRHRLGMNPAGVSATPDIYVDLDQYGGGGGAYLGKPIYATMTLSGTTLEMNVNVNGSWLPAVSTTLSRTLDTNNDGFFIGRHYWGGPQLHDGTIDEVALYARALSTGEIYQHYAAAVPEPSTLALLAIAGLLLAARRRRRW